MTPSEASSARCLQLASNLSRSEYSKKKATANVVDSMSVVSFESKRTILGIFFPLIASCTSFFMLPPIRASKTSSSSNSSIPKEFRKHSFPFFLTIFCNFSQEGIPFLSKHCAYSCALSGVISILSNRVARRLMISAFLFENVSPETGDMDVSIVTSLGTAVRPGES